jgi:hypothetical protein
MITVVLMFLFNVAVGLLITVLPTFSYPHTFITGLNYFVSGANGINFIFPIFDLFAVVGVLISFELVLWPAKFILKLILGNRIDI